MKNGPLVFRPGYPTWNRQASEFVPVDGVPVAELAEEDEDVADYVRSLEETRDTADLPEASGEAIAREFERYLRRRSNPSEGD